jgi:hypothetical protein
LISGARGRMIRRGAVHTLDAFFTAIIIATALLYASQVPREREYVEYEPLGAMGMQVLLMLDGNGSLGRWIDGGDWDKLERALRLSLPSGMSFNLIVYDEKGAVLNVRAISNGGLSGRTIESVEYVTASRTVNCPIFKLRLQLGG